MSYETPDQRPSEADEAARQYRIQRRVAEMHAEEQSRGELAEFAERAKRALLWSKIFLWGGVVLGVIVGISTVGAAFSSKSVYDPTSGTYVTTAANPSVGVVLGAIVLGLILIPVTAYLTWSFFWGFRWTWRWWRQLTSGWGCFGSITFVLIMVALFFYIPALIGITYGALGGGFYQRSLALRTIAANQAHPAGPTA